MEKSNDSQAAAMIRRFRESRPLSKLERKNDSNKKEMWWISDNTRSNHENNSNYSYSNNNSSPEPNPLPKYLQNQQKGHQPTVNDYTNEYTNQNQQKRHQSSYSDNNNMNPNQRHQKQYQSSYSDHDLTRYSKSTQLLDNASNKAVEKLRNSLDIDDWIEKEIQSLDKEIKNSHKNVNDSNRPGYKLVDSNQDWLKTNGSYEFSYRLPTHPFSGNNANLASLQGLLNPELRLDGYKKHETDKDKNKDKISSNVDISVNASLEDINHDLESLMKTLQHETKALPSLEELQMNYDGPKPVENDLSHVVIPQITSKLHSDMLEFKALFNSKVEVYQFSEVEKKKYDENLREEGRKQERIKKFMDFGTEVSVHDHRDVDHHRLDQPHADIHASGLSSPTVKSVTTPKKSSEPNTPRKSSDIISDVHHADAHLTGLTSPTAKSVTTPRKSSEPLLDHTPSKVTFELIKPNVIRQLDEMDKFLGSRDSFNESKKNTGGSESHFFSHNRSKPVFPKSLDDQLSLALDSEFMLVNQTFRQLKSVQRHLGQRMPMYNNYEYDRIRDNNYVPIDNLPSDVRINEVPTYFPARYLGLGVDNNNNSNISVYQDRFIQDHNDNNWQTYAQPHSSSSSPMSVLDIPSRSLKTVVSEIVVKLDDVCNDLESKFQSLDEVSNDGKIIARNGGNSDHSRDISKDDNNKDSDSQATAKDSTRDNKDKSSSDDKSKPKGNAKDQIDTQTIDNSQSDVKVEKNYQGSNYIPGSSSHLTSKQVLRELNDLDVMMEEHDKSVVLHTNSNSNTNSNKENEHIHRANMQSDRLDPGRKLLNVGDLLKQGANNFFNERIEIRSKPKYETSLNSNKTPFLSPQPTAPPSTTFTSVNNDEQEHNSTQSHKYEPVFHNKPPTFNDVYFPSSIYHEPVNKSIFYPVEGSAARQLKQQQQISFKQSPEGFEDKAAYNQHQNRRIEITAPKIDASFADKDKYLKYMQSMRKKFVLS